MALRIALDVNRSADLMRDDPAAVGPVRRDHEVYLPFIVLAEIRVGIRIGTKQKQNEQNLLQFINRHRVMVLFADEATTHMYAELYRELRPRGTPIPSNDLWVAALVVQHDLTLLTRDKHFDVVPRLVRM